MRHALEDYLKKWRSIHNITRNINNLILIWLEQCQAASFQTMSTTIIIENFRPSNDHSFVHLFIHHSVDCFPKGVWASWGRLQACLLFLPGPLAGSVSGWALPPRGSWPTEQLSLAVPDIGLQPHGRQDPLITAHEYPGRLFVSWTPLRTSVLEISFEIPY